MKVKAKPECKRCGWYDDTSDSEGEPFCGFTGEYHPEPCENFTEADE